MGEKFEKIRTRTLTIIIGLPVALFIINQNGLMYNATVSVIAILSVYEFCQLLKTQGYSPSFIFSLIAAQYFLFFNQFGNISLLERDILLLIILFLVFMEHFLLRRQINSLLNISLSLFCAIYIGFLLSFAIKLRSLPNGHYFLIFALFTTWVSDISAYLVGIKYGSRHIFPTISPNKTLEGSVGGLVGGAITGAFFSFSLSINPFFLLFLGFLSAFFGQIGDLFESLLKRNLNVKDSGKILPGHGGLLDCIDSILFSIPLIYCYVYYFIK